MSRYYLDEADVATARRLFDDYAQEAQRMVDARLPVPAHYLVLPRGRELERIGEPWRPYRSVASWYLWQIAQATGED